jgi:hypothetical protein
MKKKTKASVAMVASLALLAGAGTAAFAASSVINNGFFQVDEAEESVSNEGDTTITGWTAVHEMITLGESTIAGCKTADTSDYYALRDFGYYALYEDYDSDGVAGKDDFYYYGTYSYADADDYEGTFTNYKIAGFNVGFTYGEEDEDTGDYPYILFLETSPGVFTLEADWTQAQFDAVWEVIFSIMDPSKPVFGDDLVVETAVTVVDANDVGLGEEGNNILEIYSDFKQDLDGDRQRGYFAHGPAVYSEVFTGVTGRQISFDWAAEGGEDDFKAFGYLLNTETCAQTEVIDATGLFQDWTRVAVNIPADGKYRFVFIGGGHDYDFGGWTGSNLYIDNVIQRTVFDGLGLDLELAPTVGEIVPGGDVLLQGGGLIANSPLELVLRSTPVTIDLKGQTADSSGNFAFLATLPPAIEPGAHSLTLTGKKPDGTPISDVLYFEIDASGKLLSVSKTAPSAASPASTTPLAKTGVDSWSTAALALLALAMLGYGARLALSGRTRKS